MIKEDFVIYYCIVFSICEMAFCNANYNSNVKASETNELLVKSFYKFI